MSTLSPAAALEPVALPGIRSAGWPRRAAAVLIDGALVWAVAAAVAAVVRLASALLWLAFPAYFTTAHGGRRGRTVGKAALGLAVRRADTFGPLGYPRALARWLAALALWAPLLAGTAFAFVAALDESFGGSPVGDQVYLVWALSAVLPVLDSLSPLWDRRGRAWHDRLAGSIVVRI